MQSKEAYYNEHLLSTGSIKIDYLGCTKTELATIRAMIAKGKIACESFDRSTHIAVYKQTRKGA